MVSFFCAKKIVLMCKKYMRISTYYGIIDLIYDRKTVGGIYAG